MIASHLIRICFLGACLLAVSPGQAQSRQSADAAATVQAFWEAVFAARWSAAVALLDLGDVERFRRAQLDAARRSWGREYTVADLMHRDPDMPREAAEYEIRRRERERQRYPPRPFWMFYGIDSARQLERMPVEEAAMRWVQGHDPLWQVAEFRRLRHCEPDRHLDSLAASRRAIVYGGLSAGSDTAFVTFRAQWFPVPELPQFMEAPFPLPQIAVLRRGDIGWRIRALPSLLENPRGGLAGFDTRDCTARDR